MDGLDQFKANQKVAWSTFMQLEHFTGTAAPHLVRFAGIRAGAKVLDVACGTGVVSLTAARTGAGLRPYSLWNLIVTPWTVLLPRLMSRSGWPKRFFTSTSSPSSISMW